MSTPLDGRGRETTEGVASDEFRSTLSRFCSGIVAVSTCIEGEPVGMTCQSFISLSLEPPLVGFAPARTSSTYPLLRAAGRFAISVLAESQADVALALARKGRDKFAGLSWWRRPSGTVVLDDCLAWLDCTIETEHDAGDHHVVVARVHALGYTEEGLPLTYFRSSFNSIS